MSMPLGRQAGNPAGAWSQPMPVVRLALLHRAPTVGDLDANRRMDRKNKSPFCASTPAARLRPRRLPRPQRAAAARRSGPQQGVARHWLVLDRRLRMEEGSAD